MHLVRDQNIAHLIFHHDISFKIMRRTDLGKGERDDAVVVIDGILHQEPVGLGLLVQDRCGKLFPEKMSG